MPKLIGMFGERPTSKLHDVLATALARLAPASTDPLFQAAKQRRRTRPRRLLQAVGA